MTNIYIKDPAVTLIKRDQKMPVIWFVANMGGILGEMEFPLSIEILTDKFNLIGLSMGCSMVTLFEVAHHILLIFLKTGKRSVDKLTETYRIHR